MVRKDNGFQKKLLETFKVEATEHTQAISSGLIELEKTLAADEQTKVIEAVFREAHSLKGAARAVNLREIESICHSAESVFAALKRKEIALSPALFDGLHDVVDALGKLLGAIGTGVSGAQMLPVAEVLRRLDGVLKGATARSAQEGGREGQATPPPPELRQPSSAEKPASAETVRVATARLDALLFQAEELLAAKLTAHQRSVEIREAAGALAAFRKERSKIASEVKSLQFALQKGARRDGTQRTTDMQPRKLAEFLDSESAFVGSFEARLSALARSAEHDQRLLGAMVDGLLDDMKKALMLPVSSALEIFPKFVRDLSRDQKKEAELFVRGADIEIDRRILEEMRDPLIHVVRNCVDHGIETPEERKRKGKPPCGTITLAVARKNGSSVEILVSDDGAGIDAKRVLEAALNAGVVARDEVADRNERELLALVFRSGVTTSPIITDLSGRGLGLAIVREKVERLGGAIAVETQPGQGTAFRVVLPLTLATFRGIHVRAGGVQFVIPTIYVEQAARVKRGEIGTVENRETIRRNGQAVSLARLSDVLELPRKRSVERPEDTVQMVILGSADRRIAFLVDEILEEREVLVKPLGRQLSRVRNIAGATVLGTGKAIPILDVPDLLKSAAKAATAPAAGAAPIPEAAPETRSVLVAEDSITARTLLKNILESAGYRVQTAVDGIDALTRLKSERFDLVVSDVDMPRMDGFDLTARIRADKGLGELPIVLVTALESREHRERGIDVGANAYIVKSSFDQSNLLEVIRRLI